jgi:hypothetical protein
MFVQYQIQNKKDEKKYRPFRDMDIFYDEPED